MGITQAEAARILGVTRQAIRQRLKSGSLTRHADGTLDRREVETAAALRSPSRSVTAREAAERRTPKPKGRPIRPRVATDEAPAGSELDRINCDLRALRRHKKRLARRYRFGLGPGLVSAAVVNGHTFNVRWEASQLLESRVAYFARELGRTEDEIAEVVDEAWNVLAIAGVAWLGREPDDMIRAVCASPTWRRKASDASGTAATRWDRRPRRRRA